MELFEILFIALFILFPIVEQVLRRSRGGEPEEPGPDPMEAPPGEIDPPSSEREPVQAAEMVPDDLWAILTGERRPADADRSAGPGEKARPDEWATMEDDFEEVTETVEAGEEAERPWLRPETQRPQPKPQEPKRPATTYGPEAYSLESVDYEPVSLEVPLPSPAERHRRFHERIDRPAPPRRRRQRKSPVGRALRDPESLRRAFVLNEILGTPKGIV